MSSPIIIYGSTTGNTQSAAEKIAGELNGKAVSVTEADWSAAAAADLLILGTSTWGVGDLQDDWDAELDNLKGAALAGKKVALFGLGDASGFGASFVDGLLPLAEAAEAAGAELIGFTETAGYDFDESLARRDGQFLGLVLDEDNESDKTDGRISRWIDQLKEEA